VQPTPLGQALQHRADLVEHLAVAAQQLGHAGEPRAGQCAGGLDRVRGALAQHQVVQPDRTLGEAGASGPPGVLGTQVAVQVASVQVLLEQVVLGQRGRLERLPDRVDRRLLLVGRQVTQLADGEEALGDQLGGLLPDPVESAALAGAGQPCGRLVDHAGAAFGRHPVVAEPDAAGRPRHRRAE
jgi:hypothetical protein